jgi:hypothetical protein
MLTGLGSTVADNIYLQQPIYFSIIFGYLLLSTMASYYLQQIINIFYLSLTDEYYPERPNVEKTKPKISR